MRIYLELHKCDYFAEVKLNINYQCFFLIENKCCIFYRVSLLIRKNGKRIKHIHLSYSGELRRPVNDHSLKVT